MTIASDQALVDDKNEFIDRPERSSRGRVYRLITQILATKGITTSFSDEDTLVEVGLASVDMVTLMLAVENEFKVEIPQREITPEVFRSVSSIEALMTRLNPSAALQ